MRPAPIVLFAVAILSSLPAGAASDLGKVDFPTSAVSPVAQAHFVRGVAALHSFWYDEAADAFRAAQQAEPGFAMAYWGEAMTFNHPIWSEQDRDAALAALARLAPGRQERLAKAPTEREKGFLTAVEILYGEGDKDARNAAYAEAMRQLHERFPDDLEVASFYALSLIGPALTGPPGELRERTLIRAAALLEELFARNPEHPGVVHYLIHAYDDPLHAPLGLRAARVYARVAPAAHHALHMPAHIFVQLGDWASAAASNEAAWAASVAWVKRRGLPIDKRDFHSLSWLAYAYLQQGRYAKARETLEIARQAAKESDSPRIASAVKDMELRYAVETRTPRPQPAAEVKTATGCHGAAATPYDRKGDAAPVMEKEDAALALLKQGKGDEGLALLAEAAKLEDALGPPSGPPDVVKPAHELYGEVLLEQGKVEEAARQFDLALLRTPNRSASRLGAARAAARLGRSADARRHYEALAASWRQADPGSPELAEVRRYLEGGAAERPAAR